MCGFAGVLNSSSTIHNRQLQAVAAKVSFRGPDSCGTRIYNSDMQAATEGVHALFFNRLAIIDLDARSNQPFEDERYTLTFNGEIYNYTELKKSLQQAGVVFRTTSDTEVLFYALQHWGEDAVKRLNGMFAFCWLDRKEKTFIVARDRMGIKPLYYRQHNNAFVFASELDSVLGLSTGPSPQIDPSAVHMFMWMQFIPTPYTIVKGVYKLPPGHFIKGSFSDLEYDKKQQPQCFWDAYAVAQQQSAGIQPGSLEQVMVKSLQGQLIADVPLGFFLSSGVDSSLLAALVNKHFAQSQQFNFFTVAFSEETISDESSDAIDFINGFNNPSLKNHVLRIDSNFIGNRLDNLYDFFDEPFGDYTSLLNWVISEKAREFVTVALSGDGADELFWGYDRYARWQQPSLSLFNKINISSGTARLLKPIVANRHVRTKIDLELEPDPVHRYFTLFLVPALERLTSNPMWSQPIWAMQGIQPISSREDLVALMDIKAYLADAMLYKVDKASMAASLEVRVPYLDNEVVDFALALPLKYKSNEAFKHKAIVKELLQRLAPHYDINRQKKGFNFPIDNWLRFKWREQVMAAINKESLSALSLDADWYLNMVQQYYAGNKRNCLAVWYLFNLVLWHRKFSKLIPLTKS